MAHFGSEDETHVYRITGGDRWTHGVGKIGAAQPDSMWTEADMPTRTPRRIVATVSGDGAPNIY